MEKPAIAGGTPVRDTKLNYGHQYIDEADIKAVTQVLQSECLTCGPKVNELEKRLCALTGAKYAVACSNGTAALHIAAMAAGLKKGDEVITTYHLCGLCKLCLVLRSQTSVCRYLFRYV